MSKIHHQPCHVVYTDYRPVPLQHYIFPANGEGLYLVVDEKAKFRDDNFQRAMATLQNGGTENNNGNEKKNSRKQITKNFNNDLVKIVKLIMERSLDPCIVFSFSKKDCETYALQMARMEFNNEEEKTLVEQVFMNAIEGLSEDDKNLPQILTILPLLKRGIGIHHGGLLPILKEVIEILFQEGLLKCLFATETFSIGINMPAKTVVFTSTRKFDGKDFRWVTSGEYIQMSGRAGRRGKDDKGIVIQMIDEKMEPDICKNMIYGASDPLYSSYHISYNMVLNMLRVEGADPLNLIKLSFHQYQQELNAPNLLRKSQELANEASNIVISKEDIVTEYYNLLQLYQQIGYQLNGLIMQPGYILPFMQSGRLIRIDCDNVYFGWGSIVSLKKYEVQGQRTKNAIVPSRYIGNLGPRNQPISGNGEYYIELLLEVRMKENIDELAITNDENTNANNIISRLDFVSLYDKTNLNTSSSIKVASNSTILLLSVGFDCISQISAIRLNIPKDIMKDSARQNMQKGINEVCRRFHINHDMPLSMNEVPLLDIEKDLGVPMDQHDISSLITKRTEIQERLVQEKSYQFLQAKEGLDALAMYQVKVKLLQESQQLTKEATELQSVIMREELRKMKKILRKLEYINNEDILSLKGRFACEISAADELVVTNMVFAGVFNDLTVHQTVALLSCLVHRESNGNSADYANMKFRSDMQKPFRLLQSIAKDVAKLCIEVNLFTDEEEYLKTFDPALIDVAYGWSQGQKFIEICKLSEVFEGSIIRSLRRLEELLRQLASASVAIGNAELVTLFEEGASNIRRGVVFAASLYI